MGFITKTWDKVVSLFDTESASEVEDPEVTPSEPDRQPASPSQPSSPKEKPLTDKEPTQTEDKTSVEQPLVASKKSSKEEKTAPERSQMEFQNTRPSPTTGMSSKPQTNNRESQQLSHNRPKAPTENPSQYRQKAEQQAMPSVKAPTSPQGKAAGQQDHQESSQFKLCLRYPRGYEDVRELADRIIDHPTETILIDFEMMPDYQARRCLDFLTGASAVAYATLKRVNGNLFVLAPNRVLLEFDQPNATRSKEEETGFDYDVPRFKS